MMFAFPLQPNDLFLNLVLEFIPETAYSVLRSYTRAKKHMPLIVTKVMWRAPYAYAPIVH
jgi:hypothetical protein